MNKFASISLKFYATLGLKSTIQDALAAINILNSKHQPMVLILEDWHWVDEASDSAMKHIISLIAPYSLMVVVIYRPEYKYNWDNLSNYTPVVLKPLDNRQSENILKIDLVSGPGSRWAELTTTRPNWWQSFFH